MRKLISIILAIIISQISYSQNGAVTGKITDSVNKKSLALATVSVYQVSDTGLVAYRLSNESGNFRVPGLPLRTRLRIVATFSGYLPFRKEFELTTEKPEVSFLSLSLIPTSSSLEDVVVVSERPPVSYKNDTIEFNANAFKTLPTALVEDLLKKLPGIEVDRAGNITMNGRRVNRLLVDGKRFFGNDPRMATRNLPADIVDKVQVMDDQEEIARNNDGNMSNIGKVINLSLKRNIKRLLFGKVAAGAGTNRRYDIGGILNSFRDTLQVSILGYRNNTNRSSFSVSDVGDLGGMNRSGYDGLVAITSGGREGFALDGISFGGTGAGLTTSTGAGLNLNHSPNKTFSFYTQYFYANALSDVQQEQSTKRFIKDTVYDLITVNNSSVNNHTHNGGVGINWKIDPKTNFDGSVHLVATNNQFLSPVSVVSTSNKLGQLSSTAGIVTNKANSLNYNHQISLTHRFAKKGESLSITHLFTAINSPTEVSTSNINTFYFPATSTTIFQQLRVLEAPQTNFQLTASYSNPISKVLTLRINERLSYTKYGRDIVTYGVSSSTSAYDSVIANLSNGLSREQTRWSNAVTLGYRIKKVNINFSPTYLLQWINNGFEKIGNINSYQRYRDMLINLNMNTPWLNLGFSQDVNAPNISYLNPVPDNSNPLYIIQGNPGLLPTRRKQIDFSVSFSKPKKSLSYSVSGSTGFYRDYVVMESTLSNNGVQTTRPINVDGVVMGSLNMNINKQYKNSLRFFMTMGLSAGANLSKLPVVYNQVTISSTERSAYATVRLSMNWHDAFEISARYNPILTNTIYENKQFTPVNIVTQNFNTELIVRTLKRVVMETSMTYKNVSDIPVGFPSYNLYWNAAATLLMLKGDRGQLKLAIYDILNSNNFVINTVSGNSIVNINTNVLQRYAMATFSYNIRSQKKEKKQIGGIQSLFMF
jgi:hypothetical protein